MMSFPAQRNRSLTIIDAAVCSLQGVPNIFTATS